MTYMKSGLPFLYDDATGDMVGIRDADGGEALFVSMQSDRVTGRVEKLSTGRNAPIRLQSGADTLVLPGVAADLTGAVSTTQVLSYAVPVATDVVRVAWLGNGVSGATKLRIALNCSNDAWGLVACNSAKMRDAEIGVGEMIQFQSSDGPIAILHFAADSSVGAGTHAIRVAYEKD